MQEIWVQPLSQEDSLEKEMATQTSNLVWEISRTEQPSLTVRGGHKRVGHDLVTKPRICHPDIPIKINMLPYVNQLMGTCCIV